MAKRSETAVLDRTDAEPPANGIGEADPKGKKKDDEDIEYEVEWQTPFGKIELEFEPKSRKEEKDRKRAEKKRQEAAKAAERAAKKVQHVAATSGGGGGGSRIIVLAVVLAVIGAIIAAYWLFARAEEDDVVPEEFREGVAPAAEAGPQGFVAGARRRVRDAVRAGRRASRDAQDEQRRKFEDMARS